MLLLVVNYLMRTNNNIFLEQRNRQYWRNQIVKEIEERKKGNKEPVFTCGCLFHPAIQWMVVIVFAASGIYALASLVGMVPGSW